MRNENSFCSLRTSTLRKFISANQQAFSIRPAVPPFCAYALGFLCVRVCVCCSNIRVFGTRTVGPVRKARTSYRRQILFFSPTEAPLLSMATRYSPPLIFLVSFSFFPHADQACSRRCLLRPLPLEVARETLQAYGASLVKGETGRSEVARLRQTEFESLNAASCS